MNLIYENLHLKGIGGFANHAYWTSSEVSSFFAWSQYLITGEQASNEKGYVFRVRPVRAF